MAAVGKDVMTEVILSLGNCTRLSVTLTVLQQVTLILAIIYTGSDMGSSKLIIIISM